ncbi:hypothetical protein BC828DRAFT_296896 [Blastocladiella britannica]|nr:hypothetical protein BC828DRAFT_296896 [Blastocladiella britannica]
MASKHTVNLNLRVRQTAPVPLEIAAPCTLADLRLLVEAASGYPAAGQKLVYAGRVLAAALDDTNEDAVDVVATYGMRDGGTLYVVPAVVAPPIPSAASMVPNGGGSSSAAALRDDRGMQADMMRTLAGSPFVEAMLANPAFVESLIMANPQMRALAEASPEVARMLRDPATLRQMFRAARDPRAMEHMQRSNDRALANLESVPGAMAQVTTSFPFIFSFSFKTDLHVNTGPPPLQLDPFRRRRRRIRLRQSHVVSWILGSNAGSLAQLAASGRAGRLPRDSGDTQHRGAAQPMGCSCCCVSDIVDSIASGICSALIGGNGHAGHDAASGRCLCFRFRCCCSADGAVAATVDSSRSSTAIATATATAATVPGAAGPHDRHGIPGRRVRARPGAHRGRY